MKYWDKADYSNLPDGNYLIYNHSGNAYCVLHSKFVKLMGNSHPTCYGPIENLKTVCNSSGVLQVKQDYKDTLWRVHKILKTFTDAKGLELVELFRDGVNVESEMGKALTDLKNNP